MRGFKRIYTANKRGSFSNEKIPDFLEVNEHLKNMTGWKIEVVPNLCPEQHLFACLAEQTFPTSCWLRTMEQLDYLEEPDMFHDVFGHIPLLNNKSYTNFFPNFGKIALKHIDNEKAIQLLSWIYWYTIEFRMIELGDELKNLLCGYHIVQWGNQARNRCRWGNL